MAYSTATRIAIPANATISLNAADNSIIVLPAGMAADAVVMTRGGLTGLFTFDPGVWWPNANGCAFASEYLRSGHPIILQLETAADARACHRRLLAEAGR